MYAFSTKRLSWLAGTYLHVLYDTETRAGMVLEGIRWNVWNVDTYCAINIGLASKFLYVFHLTLGLTSGNEKLYIKNISVLYFIRVN